MYVWSFTTGLRRCIKTEGRAYYDDTPMRNQTCERKRSFTYSEILSNIRLQDVRKIKNNLEPAVRTDQMALLD